jgi:hypothetical protein
MQHVDLGFPKRDPANLIGLLLSLVTCLDIIKLLNFTVSPSSPKAYHISILLVLFSVLDSCTFILHVLPDDYFSLIAQIVLYCKWAFLFNSDPATSSCGTRTRALTNEWDVTTDFVVNCLCDEFESSVEDSGSLSHAK